MDKKPLNLLVFFIFLIVGIISIFYFNQPIIKSDETVFKIIEDSIFKYIDNKSLLEDPYDYNNFYLLFDKEILEIRNFIKIFNPLIKEGAVIKRIYPYINPKYNSYLIKEVGEIKLPKKGLEEALSDVFDEYLRALNKFGLDEELDRVNVYGLKIRIVLVNCSNKSLFDFLKNNPRVKISNELAKGYRELSN